MCKILLFLNILRKMNLICILRKRWTRNYSTYEENFYNSKHHLHCVIHKPLFTWEKLLSAMLWVCPRPTAPASQAWPSLICGLRGLSRNTGLWLVSWEAILASYWSVEAALQPAGSCHTQLSDIATSTFLLTSLFTFKIFKDQKKISCNEKGIIFE